MTNNQTLIPFHMQIFFLQNADGKFFKSRGQNGYGPRWVDTMEKAKPYTKIGPAKGQITRWSGLYPDFPVPLLVICDVTIKERKDLTKDVGVKRGKALQALVNEANRYSQQMKESPEPTSYKDRPAIEYRSSLARYHNTAIYLIKTRFKGIDLSTIGLTDIKLSS